MNSSLCMNIRIGTQPLLCLTPSLTPYPNPDSPLRNVLRLSQNFESSNMTDGGEVQIAMTGEAAATARATSVRVARRGEAGSGCEQ